MTGDRVAVAAAGAGLIAALGALAAVALSCALERQVFEPREAVSWWLRPASIR